MISNDNGDCIGQLPSEFFQKIKDQKVDLFNIKIVYYGTVFESKSAILTMKINTGFVNMSQGLDSYL